MRRLLIASALFAPLACGPRPMVSDKYASESKPEAAPATFDYAAYIDAVYNKRNPDAIDQFFSPDVVVHSVAPDVEGGKGTEYLKQLAKALMEAFPDVKLTVADLVKDGDRLAARVTVEGTHKGEFLGIKPTGKTVRVANFAMYRIENGKIVETWSLVDVAALRRQLTD